MIQAETLPGILPHHLKELRASGLNDETIIVQGIRSEVNYDQAAQLLGWKKVPKRMLPALVWPYTGLDGTNGYYRIKADNPRIVGGKPVKHESPKGRSNEVFFPQVIKPIIESPTAELLLTEGEKKSLAATQFGFPCIGLTGIYGWKDGKSESLLPSLERIRWQDRRVYIAFDSDILTNADVQAAESRLASHLQKRGAIVLCVRLQTRRKAHSCHDDGSGTRDP